MNDSMKEKLQPYLDANGIYDIRRIRMRWPGDDLKAVRSILWADDETMEGADFADDGLSDEWRAAEQANEARYKEIEAAQDAAPIQVAQQIVDAIMSPDDDRLPIPEILKRLRAKSAVAETVRLLLAIIDTSDDEIAKANRKLKHLLHIHKNRALFTLEKLNLAYCGDGMGEVDLSGAREALAEYDNGKA